MLRHWCAARISALDDDGRQLDTSFSAARFLALDHCKRSQTTFEGWLGRCSTVSRGNQSAAVGSLE